MLLTSVGQGLAVGREPEKEDPAAGQRATGSPGRGRRDQDEVTHRNTGSPTHRNTGSPSRGRRDQEGGTSPHARDKDPAWWPNRLYCGGAFSALLTSASEVEASAGMDSLFVWGSHELAGGAEGAGGRPKGRDLWEPAVLRRSFRRPVRLLAVGLRHCLAVAGEAMYSWGDGARGQLGTGHLAGSPCPQLVSRPSNVLWVSAGEEHSACIAAEGGAAYTWGNADGGRLGLGRCLAEGTVLVPRRADVTTGGAGRTEAVAFRAVACGSEHTAFVTQEASLFTCGMGWYGRLGHGGTENKYSPALVRAAGLLVKDAFCALYHTCVVDERGVLWVCGRDSSVCRSAGNHALSLVPFEPFCAEPRRFVRSLATCDQHTLAITECPAEDGAVELWVWGLNNRGQLGLLPHKVPRLDVPRQLDLPDLSEGLQPSYVATGPGHSLCLVRPKRRGRRQATDADHDPVVYAWGAAAAGRLGVPPAEAEAKLAAQRRAAEAKRVGKRREATAALSSCEETAEPPQATHLQTVDDPMGGAAVHNPEARIYTPIRVPATWKPSTDLGREQRRLASLESAYIGDEGLLCPSETWFDAQLKLWHEDKDQKMQALEERSREVSLIYQGLMDDIRRLWDRPASADPTELTEYHLRQRETDVEREYLRTLMVLGRSGAAPRLEGGAPGSSRTDPELRAKLHLCEELLWVLQQQPLYLANLGAAVRGEGGESEEAAAYQRITGRLFANLKEDRTRNLFAALLRLLVEAETASTKSLEELYNPEASNVPALVAQMCANPCFMDCLAMPILDPDDDRSLVTAIIRYTLSRDGEIPRAARSADVRGLPDFTGVLPLNMKEYEELVRKHRNRKGKESDLPADVKRTLHQHFQDEAMQYYQLFTKESLTSRDEDEVEQPHPGKVAAFVEYFIRDVLKSDEPASAGRRDIRTLLVRAFGSLMNQSRLVGNMRAAQSESVFLPGVCAPIGALLLSGVLAPVLSALESGPFALLRLRIARRVREMEAELLDEYNNFRARSRQVGQAEKAIKGDTRNMIQRVFWNLQALARFFRAAFHPGETEVAPEANACMRQIRDLTCECLLDTLQGQQVQGEGEATAMGPQPTAASCAYGEAHEGAAETQLIADLYASHFSLQESIVRLSTVDILELTNMLWKYMETGSRPADARIVRIRAADEDRVFQLVKAILPNEHHHSAPSRNRKPPARSMTTNKAGGKVFAWSADSHGHLWAAAEHGEWHNFRMRARFLEFEHGGQEEPTICEVSQAPIPRSLASELQSKRPTVHTFRFTAEESGPTEEIDGRTVYVFARLEELMQELSGHAKDSSAVKYSLCGSTFSDLRTEFEYVQKRISRDIEEGRAGPSAALLVRGLEEGKQLVDKIRDKWEAGAFLRYLDRGTQRRGRYALYLRRAKEAAEGVRNAQQAYRADLQEQCSVLAQVAKLTQSCELPEVMHAAAQTAFERLAFARAKRLKLKRRRDHPTPAQDVLEALRSASVDGKVTAEMREMADMPARSFRLRQLVDKGVVVKVNLSAPPEERTDSKVRPAPQERTDGKVRDKMCLNFQYKDEGYIVQIFVQTTLLKEFTISRQDIHLAERGRKNAVIPYAGDLVWLNCFRLRRMLAYIAAEGGV